MQAYSLGRIVASETGLFTIVSSWWRSGESSSYSVQEAGSHQREIKYASLLRKKGLEVFWKVACIVCIGRVKKLGSDSTGDDSRKPPVEAAEFSRTCQFHLPPPAQAQGGCKVRSLVLH